MKIAWGTLFAVLVTAQCSCTTVIVLWTPTGAILGVDAKIRFGDGKPAGNACKIGVSNNIAWAHAGFVGVRDSPDAISNILTEELGSSDAVDLRISRTESRISAALTSVLNLPLIKPDVLAHPEKHQVQFVVVALESGTTRIIVRSFMPRKGTAGNIEINTIRDSCRDASDCGTSQYEGLGFHHEADTIVKTDLTIWNRNPTDAVEYLIDTEIKARPDDVGPPIAMVGLDATGVHWISRGACADK